MYSQSIHYVTIRNKVLYHSLLKSGDQVGSYNIAESTYTSQDKLHEMYVPSSLGVQALDRIRISSSEYYRVETVKPRRYSAVDVIELGVDTRATTTSTTTTSSSTSTTTTTA